MEVGAYSLHLYCDTKGCLNGQSTGSSIYGTARPLELAGPTESDCKKQARAWGWVFHRDGTHSCRKHSNKRPKGIDQ